VEHRPHPARVPGIPLSQPAHFPPPILTGTPPLRLRSTLVGDVAEVKAIKKVFTDTSNLKMNATKSLIGHCLGAAAGIEAVAVVKAIETGWLHPTLNQHNLVDEVRGAGGGLVKGVREWALHREASR
jgi:hypothetical protein